MSVLPIRAYMVNARNRFSILIHLGHPSGTWRELVTRGHKSWTPAQSIPAISAQVLEKILPTVAYLSPVYEPVLVALKIGSILLAARFAGTEQR
jgi:hypothetical protein